MKTLISAILLTTLSFSAMANPRWNEQEQRRIAQEEAQKEQARERAKSQNGGRVGQMWDSNYTPPLNR